MFRLEIDISETCGQRTTYQVLGRSENPEGGANSDVVGIICSPLIEIGSKMWERVKIVPLPPPSGSDGPT